MTSNPNAAGAPRFLDGGGECGELIASIGWAGTTVGPMAAWPPCLKVVVATLLRSRHPMFLWWGADLIQFYNDAYRPSFGVGKHPRAMGQRARECWEEIWPVIGPQIEGVMREGRATWHEDALVPIFRNGRLEDVYWTYGYSPVVDESGEIRGTLVVCTETTARVVAERRAAFLRSLADQLAPCVNDEEVLRVVARVLTAASSDVPFALVYEWNEHNELVIELAIRLDEGNRERLDGMLRRSLGSSAPGSPALLASHDPDSPVFVRPLTFGTRGALVVGTLPGAAADQQHLDFIESVGEQIDVASARVRAAQMRGVLESERRGLLLQAPMPTALMTGPDHVFELANPLYRQMVGGRELVGKSYRQAFPELVGTALPAILDRVYQTGEAYVAPESCVPLDRNGDGVAEECFFRFTLQAIRDNRGVVFGMMAVAVDLTEQVAARRVLEKTVVEREALLRELEQANHAKDEFLATVSHELRTPLNAILGWARLLGESGGVSDVASYRRALVVIERNASAQAQLIEDMLDVSRIISGKLRIHLGSVALEAVVEAAIETVRPSALAKDITIEVAVDESIGPISADADRLQQVTWNLLSNAVKFTPRGGTVTVKAGQRGDHVRLSVSDTGKGIRAAVLPHVFERFRQDDSSSTRQHSGLGLGLAIVRHLVELHGGRVHAESEGEGKGATVIVELPLAALALTESGAILPVQPAQKGAAPNRALRLAGIRVLVVDDEPDSRDLVATVLECAGAAVVTAESVEVAMAVLASRSDVSAIVSDIGMPYEDGYSFMQRLRSHHAARGESRVPALALTAYARGQDRRKALAAGFDGHESKPVAPAKLVDLVAGLVGR